MGNGIDVRKEQFEVVTVLDKPMLFACCRVDRSTVPKGLYVYDVRHDDDQTGLPVQIGDHILVNHWGTLISNQPISLEQSPSSGRAYKDIDPENDWNYEGYAVSLTEYLAENSVPVAEPIKAEPKATNGRVHVIWSNYDLDLDDWRADLLEEYPDADEQRLYELMMERNASYLDDERINLNIRMNQPILVICDLGLWNGRRMGYAEFPSGNIRDCLFTATDYVTWYVDKEGDFRCDAIHHDGTNHYLYRVYKNGVSESSKERLKEKIIDGTVTRADITRFTKRLGDDIGKVYGWTFPQPGKRKQQER